MNCRTPQKKTALQPSKVRSAVNQNPKTEDSGIVDITPRMPRTGTNEHRVLAELSCRGPRGLSTPDVLNIGGSWRLAASVHTLRKLGWPVRTHTVHATRRKYARYVLEA